LLAYISVIAPVFILVALSLSIAKDVFKYMRPLPSQYKKILEAYFVYYQRLSPEKKRDFEKRVNRFIRLKHFIPRNLKEVSDEMKVLISASAVQLTFGLHEIYLTHFNRILIYPDSYYSTINKQYHKGEVNPKWGTIALSWKDFLEGFEEKKNAKNLGLHEMAHALHLEDKIVHGNRGFLNEKLLSAYERLSRITIEKIRNGEDHFFRKYAGSNEEEFFAVSVETFFECPEEFLNKHPKLYHTMAGLLQQDPLEMYMSIAA
jgi:hypothetical protein